MAIKNSIIESQLTAFSSAERISSQSESDRFEKFSMYCCEKGNLKSGVNPFDIHLHGSEFGIDGVAIIVNGELVDNLDQLDGTEFKNVEFHFYQSKTSASFDTGDVLKFFSAVIGFFEDGYEPPSDQMEGLWIIKNELFENSGQMDSNPSLKLFYISTGSYQSPIDIEREIETTRSRLEATNLFSSISVDMVGANSLQDWYRNTTKAVSTDIEFPDNVVMPSVDNIEEAYIGYIDATEIVKLTTSSGTSINPSVFYDNIRDYDSSSEINHTIANALENDEGSLFVFRNNGITVVAKDLKRTGNKFRVTDYQIVNGCQTSHIIFNNSDKIDGTSVPFRLIKCENDKDISSIIIGTNLQNPVKKEQFWSLTPFMKNFEEYSSSLPDEDKRIYFERRENQYRDATIEKVRIISSTNLLKAVTAVLFFEGNRSGRAYAAIRKEYAPILFEDDHEVAIYHMAAFCFYRLEYLWRNSKLDKSYKIYRYLILTGLGRVLTDSKKLLELPKAEAKKKALSITNYISDDERFMAVVGDISKNIDDVVKLNIDSSNNARDLIRSEDINRKITTAILTIPTIDLSNY